eukprot:m.133287 g.133287  ORF g.133287 m.133287 type:complete len:231 (+) comp29666_c0_seq1:170-862(+)
MAEAAELGDVESVPTTVARPPIKYPPGWGPRPVIKVEPGLESSSPATTKTKPQPAPRSRATSSNPRKSSASRAAAKSSVAQSNKPFRVGVRIEKSSYNPRRKRKNYFTRELRKMMYGFGDVHEPLDSTVIVLEDLVQDYILNVAVNAMETAKRRGAFKVEDILFYLRNDRKKYLRVKEMLDKMEKIREARRPFEAPPEANDIENKASDVTSSGNTNSSSKGKQVSFSKGD